jgi:protein gp37
MSTKIEWAEETWNPVTGCTPISEGCQNCYAKRMANRLKGRCGYDADNPFKVTLHPERLDQPLCWKKPRKIFVCSMGDMFHEDVSGDFLYEIWGIMAQCPQHIFMVLTKRPEIMRAWYNDVFLRVNPLYRKNPLPNIWLGVTAENQARADERIPVLLQIPAAKRFVSIEPMLGPIDLSRWIIPRTPFTPENAPDTWSDFTWPDWVPKKVREQIEDFWGQLGRKPKDWAENAIHNDSPPFGMHMGYRDERNGEAVYGKWIFAWNNIGRLIGDNGEIYYPSIPRAHLLDATRYYWHDLHWVICGGETGSGARPMRPDWVRSLRDQCQASGTPFFFKSWGEWGPDGISCSPVLRRVGKKAAGRLLDEREYSEYPEVTT